jgi:serine/threonine protein phosphatase PrpC
MHISIYYKYINIYIWIFICKNVYIGHTITIANIGDSRITLGSKRNTKMIDKDLLEGVPSSLLQATPLSIDHKPSIQSEKERILQNGEYICIYVYIWADNLCLMWLNDQ